MSRGTAAAKPRIAALFSAFVIGSATLLILGIQPIVLGALVDVGHLTMAQLGRVATGEILALGIGSAIGPALMKSSSIRLRVLFAAGILIVINLLTIHTSSVGLIFIARGAAGFVSGILLGASIVTITRATDPDRVLGLFYGIITIPQAVAGFILPIYVLPIWGSAGGFLVLALMAGLAFLVAPFLDSTGLDRLPVHQRTKAVWSPAIVLACAAIIAQNAATGAIWSYVDRIAVIRGFNAATIGTAFGASLLMQIIGGFLVAITAWRLPYLVTLISGLIIQAILVILIGTTTISHVFISSTAAFGFFWIALLPFYLRIVIELDPSREVALLLFGIGIVGFSVGPFTASFFVNGADSMGAVIISVIFFVVASIGYILAGNLHPKYS